MKKILLIFSVMLLLFMFPLDSYASASSSFTSQFVESEDSYTFEFEGEMHTLTLVSNNDVQTVYIENKDGIETASYNKVKDELRFNGELVEDEILDELKGTVNELHESETLDFSPFSNTGYNWKFVKSYSNSFNITVATILAVTGVILLIPTGTGAAAGVILSAKVIATLASATVAASGSTGQKVFYYQLDTYYSPKNGLYNNRFIVNVWKQKDRRGFVTKVIHTTPYGKKY